MPLKIPSKNSSFPQKCKMKQSRIYITPHKGTKNSVNGTKNGANMPEEPMWTTLLRCMRSAEPWILLFTTNCSKYLRCQIHWPDLWRKPGNSIRIGAPLLALLEDSDNRTHAFKKSQKKNLRSMLSHDPLHLDRTKDKDVDVDVEEAMVVEDSLWNNASSALTTTSASTVANLDTSLSIVLNCQIINLVLAFDHKAADLPSDKSIPFQKKGWKNFHLKMKAKLILPLLTSLNHWLRST